MTVTLPSGKTNPELDRRLDICREAIDSTRQTVNFLDKLLAEFQDMHTISTQAFSHARVQMGAAWRALGFADEYLKEAHS